MINIVGKRRGFTPQGNRYISIKDRSGEIHTTVHDTFVKISHIVFHTGNERYDSEEAFQNMLKEMDEKILHYWADYPAEELLSDMTPTVTNKEDSNKHPSGDTVYTTAEQMEADRISGKSSYTALSTEDK